jgi:chemotaxis methyl-accepting protein methylase
MKVLQISSASTKKQISPAFGDCAIRNGGEKLATHLSYIGRELCINRKMLDKAAIDMLAADKGCEYLFCGCSDGSEIFDIFMSLTYCFFENKVPFKYLPKFRAFDCSPQMVNIAKNGRINISNVGMNYIKTTYPKFNFFINEGDIIRHKGDNIEELEQKIGSKVEHSYQFQPKLLEKIEFYTSNMLEEFGKISSDICRIIFCRNVARYNSKDDQQKAAKLLDKNLSPDSLIVVGYCDEHNITDENNNIIEDLEKNPNSASRLPFVEALFNGCFGHEKSISYDGLVYKKY